MTKQEINIEIAEYCGWKNIREQDYQPIGTDPYIDGPSQVWVGIHPESDSNSDEYEAIPNYCNNLNAMHEAENTLNADQQYEYAYVLDGLIENRSCEFDLIHASARMRAEAFVRTIGKWD